VFSDQGSTIENTKADPEANLWYQLAEVEYACAAGDEAYKNFERTAPAEPLQQAAVAKLRLAHVLREQPLPGALVSELADFYKHLNTAGESFGRTDIPEWTSYGEMVQPYLFAGLVVALSNRAYPDDGVVSEWRETVQRTKLTNPLLANWLDYLEKWGEVD